MLNEEVINVNTEVYKILKNSLEKNNNNNDGLSLNQVKGSESEQSCSTFKIKIVKTNFDVVKAQIATMLT